jgi:hypothetical protein
MTQPQNVSRLRLFGFPWWAVGLGLAAIVVLAVVIRNHFKNVSAAASQSALDANAATADFQTGLVTDQSQYGLPAGPVGAYLGSDVTNPAYPVGITPQGIPGPVTNQQWARLVADQLIAKGDDPTLVANALTKYLNGATPSAQENAVINLALTSYGQPPEGIIPVQIVTGNSGGPSASSGGTTNVGPGVTPPASDRFLSTGNRPALATVFASNARVPLGTLIKLNPWLTPAGSIPPHTLVRVA